MFELFGALLGGAYIANKLSSEKRRHLEMEDNYSKMSEIMKKLKNYGYETKLREIVKSGSKDEKNELLEEMSEDLDKIFKGQLLDYKEEFADYRKGVYAGIPVVAGFPTIWEAFIQLRLAKEGYVGCDAYNVDKPMFGYTENDYTKFVSRAIGTQICKKIEKYLILAHPDIPEKYLTFYVEPLNPSGSEMRLGYNFIGRKMPTRRASWHYWS